MDFDPYGSTRQNMEYGQLRTVTRNVIGNIQINSIVLLFKVMEIDLKVPFEQ